MSTPLQCQVRSAWHIEVAPVGCVIHRTFHLPDTDLVLCAYGPGSRRTARDSTAGKTTDPGVLVVDACDGSIKATVSFPSQLPTVSVCTSLSSPATPCSPSPPPVWSSQDDTVVWMTASRCLVAGSGSPTACDEVAVACVMSSGILWRFRVNNNTTTKTKDVIVGRAVWSDALLTALASEASPMEDLVLAMGVPDGNLGTSRSDDPHSRQSGSLEGNPSSDTKPGHKGTETTPPEFISERGYRGVKPGYTYWDGTIGKESESHRGGETGQQHRPGYYRNDVMRDILAAQRERERAGAGQGQQGVARSSAAARSSTHKLLRCFLYLPRASKFVTCAHQPENGMLTVGEINLGLADQRDGQCTSDPPDATTDMSGSSSRAINAPCTVSNIDGLLGHMSGVLTLAASPDEQYVASGSYDQTIRIYETASWTCLKVLKGHGGGIKCLAFSDDGTQLISAASDNTTRVWSTKTWMCMRQLHGRHEDATWPVCQSFLTCSMGKLLVSGSNGLFGGSNLKVFDVTSGDCLATFAQLRFDHKGSCSAICLIAHNTRRKKQERERGEEEREARERHQRDVETLWVVTAATDASLAGWTCDISHKDTKPLLAKGFLCS